ncbi:MAG: D-glycerate dehydrogenase [Calditrichia bacterium]
MQSTNSKKVLVTRRIPESQLEILRKEFQVEVYDKKGPIPRTLLLEKIATVDGLLSLLSEQIDRELFEHAPRLKVVSNFAVGYNNIDVAAATEFGVVVTNTPDVLTDATADLSWALLLAVARRVVEGDRQTRPGRILEWEPDYLLGSDLKGRTLGILGAGRIGQAVAERSRGWDMQVLYFDRGQNSFMENKLGARRKSLDELLAAADFVSIHLPLTEETRHLINADALNRMKSTAYLINTARGPIVDEQALVKALREEGIAGAGLDVFEDEPELAPGLAELENVVLTPHIGSATTHTRHEMARLAAINLRAVLEGEKPPFPVNPEIFEKLK